MCSQVVVGTSTPDSAGRRAGWRAFGRLVARAAPGVYIALIAMLTTALCSAAYLSAVATSRTHQGTLQVNAAATVAATTTLPCPLSVQNADTATFAECPSFMLDFSQQHSGPLTSQYFNIFT